jgi:hypothetical protein
LDIYKYRYTFDPSARYFWLKEKKSSRELQRTVGNKIKTKNSTKHFNTITISIFIIILLKMPVAIISIANKTQYPIHYINHQTGTDFTVQPGEASPWNDNTLPFQSSG